MSRKAIPAFSSSLALCLVAVAAACSSSPHSTAAVTSNADADAAPVMPFQADPPSVYVAKVKNVLVGLPPTDREIETVEADPTAAGQSRRRAG